MRDTIEKFTEAMLITGVEKFGGARITSTSEHSMANAVASMVSLVIIYVLLLLVGKFLWNEYLVKYVTIFKPIPGIIELMAISVLVRLFLA
jgi:hypothetical protein